MVVYDIFEAVCDNCASFFILLKSMMIKPIFISLFFSAFVAACNDVDTKPPTRHIKTRMDYIKPIRGKSDSIPTDVRNRGEVLVAYSDCKTCHTIDERFKGPAFKDIAARYPVNEGYVAMLAERIIVGGSGAWGYAVMSPHPDISREDAKKMVKYILSLKE